MERDPIITSIGNKCSKISGYRGNARLIQATIEKLQVALREIQIIYNEQINIVYTTHVSDVNEACSLVLLVVDGIRDRASDVLLGYSESNNQTLQT